MTERRGFLIVDKPPGVTSFSMVALVRRLTGVRRVGHAGTLDPLASGVLPVAIGAATRLIEYIDDEYKTYLASVPLRQQQQLRTTPTGTWTATGRCFCISSGGRRNGTRDSSSGTSTRCRRCTARSSSPASRCTDTRAKEP